MVIIFNKNFSAFNPQNKQLLSPMQYRIFYGIGIFML